MEDYVALLALRLEVGQAFPGLEVFGAGDGCGGRGGREVAGGCRVIVAFGTEYSVNPAVLVPGEAHVVDVGGRDYVVRHGHGIVPKAEVVNPVGALGHCEERLAVGTLHADHQQVLAVHLYRAGVEGGVHADALHQVGVGLLVEVVAPEQGRVGRCDNRVLVACEYAVAFVCRFVLAGEQRLVACRDFFQFFFKALHHIVFPFLCFLLSQFHLSFFSSDIFFMSFINNVRGSS